MSELPGFSSWAGGWSEPGIQSLVIIQTSGSSTGWFVYNGEPALGNLPISWSTANQVGSVWVDPFGNDLPAPNGMAQGQLTGVQIIDSLITNPTIAGGALTGSTLAAPSVSGGTITETVVTFDSVGGVLTAYATTTTTVTQTANGTYTITFPTTVSVADITMTAAGAGGNGSGSISGQSTGGPGAGGGETAREPAYPVVGGNTYTYVVGNGGTGGVQGQGGTNGGDSTFDNGGVHAHGGQAFSGFFLGGKGGTGSTNSVHFNGGDGASSIAGHTGGCGAGGSAGTTGAGGNGTASAGSTGGAGGAAGTGGGAAGGAGGNNGVNGANGGFPGAGGGGAGFGSNAQTFTKTYHAIATYAYQGADGHQPNTLINTNGSAVHGGDFADTYNGDAKSFLVFPSTIASDLAGATVNSITLTLSNQHTWFNSGMTVVAGLTTQSSFGSTQANPATPLNDQFSFSIGEGATKTVGCPSSWGTAFQSGGARSVVLFPGTNNLAYYGYFAGGTNPTLTITYTVSGTPTQAGAGADGKSVIVYTNTSAFVCGISPTAQTLADGTQLAAGYTGPVTAIQPASAPAVPETWHTLSLNAGYVQQAGSSGPKYRLRSDNRVDLTAVINASGGGVITAGAIATLPAGYRPNATVYIPCGLFGETAFTANYVTINGSGVITIPGGNGITAVVIGGSFPLGV